MPNTNRDPTVIVWSIVVFRLLGRLYPRPFRDEYGPHMQQVFRDYSLATLRRAGVAGLPPVWARMLFDLLKTAAEEHAQRGVTMTRETFIRLSGWCLMVGSLLLMLAVAGFTEEASVRQLLIDTLGTPTTAGNFAQLQAFAKALSTLILVGGLGLMTPGMLGLALRYGKKSGELGEYSLWLAFISNSFATAGVIALTLGLEVWSLLLVSVLFTFLFLGLFGIAALRLKPMRRGNWVPLVAGWPFAGALVYMNFAYQGIWQTAGLPTILMLVSLVALVLLGLILAQSTDQEEDQRVATGATPA